jgi:hypothetical protein
LGRPGPLSLGGRDDAADVITEADTFARALDTELALLESAIRLVASGAATRVVVSNLAYGRVVIEPARVFAEEAGVGLVLEPAANAERVTAVVTAAQASKLAGADPLQPAGTPPPGRAPQATTHGGRQRPVPPRGSLSPR